ncbi:hypothetical protein CR203_09255 [Salipaludibacillus neizhouensis]|uniref:Uncharacterized protein n=1 Tax=Salipaludibacillus neizhouensis TaxID=885475 RepID=A0A3A9KS87_9BACI|nr:hypothetical protein [Salipaludibacillus neizhouensis]RKL67526.1 hypothetical protein CR203_09255 [Salipaludibacillus neizhouensis]
MNWRERLLEQSWVIPLLPNYMKPLEEPSFMNEQTKEFIFELEEFISDLSSLSELPRLNKTFKRSIQGFAYKIKIKEKKIHIEMIDTNKSSSTIKKRVYITTYRQNVKTENGFGKIIDSTIYYQMGGKTTTVRNIRRHPLFQSLFHHIHRLDLSLSGEPVPSESQLAESTSPEQSITPSPDVQDQVKALLSSAEHSYSQYQKLDHTIAKSLKQLVLELQRCTEEYHLLNVEEKHHLKRMIQHDLPNLLKTYQSLSDSHKHEKYHELLDTLSTMNTFLKRQASDLQATRMDRMNHLLKLNELRYKQNEKS